MDQNHRLDSRGYYSLLMYRSDPVRGEFRNIAVVYVDETGAYSGIRSIRPGSVARSLQEHGLVAGVIKAIETRFQTAEVDTRNLRQLTEAFSNTLVFSDPQPAVSRDGPKALLDSLYSALVAPKAHASAGYTKGHVLDNLSRWYKSRGGSLEIGSYLDDFVFDAILSTPTDVVCVVNVTSFAGRQLNARRTEEEVGHFLYAASKVDVRCIGVVQPPSSNAVPEMRRLEERVSRWFSDSDVAVLTPQAMRETILTSPSTSGTTTQLEFATAT